MIYKWKKYNNNTNIRIEKSYLITFMGENITYFRMISQRTDYYRRIEFPWCIHTHCITCYAHTIVYHSRRSTSLTRHSIVLLIFYYHLRNQKKSRFYISECVTSAYVSQGNVKRFSIWFRCSYSFFSFLFISVDVSLA